MLDIVEAIERIRRHTSQGRRAFENNELIQTWTVHHLQIVGEAARKLTDDFRGQHSEVPWAQIIAMRNILVHDDFRVDVDEVWATVEREPPDSMLKVGRLLAESEGDA